MKKRLSTCNAKGITMAVFNQQGQNVGQQFNADEINIGRVSNRTEFRSVLEKLGKQIDEAVQTGELEPTVGAQARSSVNTAIEESSKSHPDKNKIGDALKTATRFVKDTVAVAGLFEALEKAGTLVASLF
jgi:hypothetical protein